MTLSNSGATAAAATVPAGRNPFFHTTYRRMKPDFAANGPQMDIKWAIMPRECQSAWAAGKEVESSLLLGLPWPQIHSGTPVHVLRALILHLYAAPARSQDIKFAACVVTHGAILGMQC